MQNIVNLPYAVGVIQPLKVLFLQDEFNEIPDITLNPNSDLSLITSNVAALSIVTSATDSSATQTEHIFDAITEYVLDNHNTLRLMSLEKAAKGMATTLENSYHTINEVISPVVEHIKKDIQERYIVLMKREKAEVLIDDTKVEPDVDDYYMLSWESLSSPRCQNQIIETACTNAGIVRPAISPLNLSYITRKADFSSKFNDVKLPADVLTTLQTKLAQVVASSDVQMDEQEIFRLSTRYLDKESYALFCADNLRKFDNKRASAENSLVLIDLMKKYNVISDVLMRVASDVLSTETLQQLGSNVDLVNNTTYAVKYWLLATKELTFKDKLILTPTILNVQVYQEFVQDGKSIVDIHNHLRAFHLDIPVPANGISVATVMNSPALEALEKTASKLKSQEVFIKSRCLFGAYEHAISKFVIDGTLAVMFPDMATESAIRSFTSRAMAKASFLSGSTANIDKVLYDVIISVFYEKSLEATIYKYLGKGFSNLAKTADGDITDNEIIEAECGSVVELLVDYLFDNVVCDGGLIENSQESVY